VAASPPPGGAPHREAVVGRDLTLAYGQRVALARSDFTLPAARVTALVGPNGSGKSTLLSAIAGLLTPRGGTLRVLGQPASTTRGGTAYVLQTTQANHVLPVTVREVVTMARFGGRGLLGRLRARDRQAVVRAMERLEITDLAERHLRELSGGQRQRVLVAQGLAQDADVLLLDEPVTGLDLVSRQRILEAVAEERDAGRTVVLTTHDLEDAEMADHVLLLAGRIVASGSPDEVLTAQNLHAAYSGRLLRGDVHVAYTDEHVHPTSARH
jgi:iron complex transport system ATP-binding protein